MLPMPPAWREVFLDELLRNGVTTALTFCTSHPQSVDALIGESQRRGLRMITGKVLQDPPLARRRARRDRAELIDTESLIRQLAQRDRLGYAITPRFAPQLHRRAAARRRRAGGEATDDVWIHSHVAENKDEVRWARELFPGARSYLSVYQDFGLMRERAVYAHCIHFDDEDRAPDARHRHRLGGQPRPATCSSAAASSTTKAPCASAIAFGLASDVGGGTSFSPFHTMLAAYYVGREGQTKPGVSMRLRISGGNTPRARRVRWGSKASSATSQPGCEADFVVIDPKATPCSRARPRSQTTSRSCCSR
jgi:guanine deaminase